MIFHALFRAFGLCYALWYFTTLLYALSGSIGLDGAQCSVLRLYYVLLYSSTLSETLWRSMGPCSAFGGSIMLCLARWGLYVAF